MEEEGGGRRREAGGGRQEAGGRRLSSRGRCISPEGSVQESHQTVSVEVRRKRAAQMELHSTGVLRDRAATDPSSAAADSG